MVDQFLQRFSRFQPTNSDVFAETSLQQASFQSDKKMEFMVVGEQQFTGFVVRRGLGLCCRSSLPTGVVLFIGQLLNPLAG
ncbi:hypothetical protein ACS0TY_001763 [Phlomoides rotata]